MLLAVIPIWVLSLSCSRDTTLPPDQRPEFSAPVVFIPVGTVRTPLGIAVDGTGNIWVSDGRRALVRRFAANGAQLDSATNFLSPSRMGIDNATGNILVVDNGTIVSINPVTRGVNTLATLIGSPIDGSAVYDVNSGQSATRQIAVRQVGDVAGASNGDIYLHIAGSGTDNAVIRVRSGIAKAIAASSALPANQFDLNAKFVAVDAFGTVYTAFAVGSGPTGNPLRLFSLTPNNLILSHPFAEAVVTGGAQGGGIDAAGNLFIADAGAMTPQMVVVSTIARKVIDFYPTPSVQGMAQPAPRDVAVGPDGSVYVAVSDLLQTAGDPGAVLKYTRN